jgi:hypothetical protein
MDIKILNDVLLGRLAIREKVEVEVVSADVE